MYIPLLNAWLRLTSGGPPPHTRTRAHAHAHTHTHTHTRTRTRKPKHGRLIPCKKCHTLCTLLEIGLSSLFQ
jgi:hypothetical protein